ncbi:hypothetical protein [Micromonospora sp. WMMD1082]|uniref:hypothetical protein n=1 Tax=Micromonospora sp. WMMD1082 TaxID=3016104 RepID=UPI00241686C6|nr:hypothetical protein [Micromonospora sp. WMMD1082]MDG4793698.1 hypothetical protein [Micromonospora sp. WMMD1082]
MSRAYLLVLGDRDGIAWVLREQRMAFPAGSRAEVSALAAGDELFLYATRGAWHNPTRDRGRIIGHATVVGAVQLLRQPLELAGREFRSGCPLHIDGAVVYPGGVELAPLVEELDAFPKPQAWSIYLRRPLLALSAADTALLSARLNPLLTPLARAAPTYPSRSTNGGPSEPSSAPVVGGDDPPPSQRMIASRGNAEPRG